MTVQRRIVDFWMYQNATKILRVTVRDLDSNLVPLTGVKSITWTIAASVDAAEIFASKSIGSGIELPDPDGAVFEVTIGPPFNDVIPPGLHYHEARLVDAADHAGYPVAGEARIVDTRIT